MGPIKRAFRAVFPPKPRIIREHYRDGKLRVVHELYERSGKIIITKFYKNGEIESRCYIDGINSRMIGFYPNGDMRFEIYKQSGALHRIDGPATRMWCVGDIEPYIEQYWENGVCISG